MRASAVREGDGLAQTVDVNGRHTLVTDEPPELGGSDDGPAPHELLPAALAACIATMIAMYARTKGWHLGEFRVDVDYDTDQTPRRFEIAIRLPESLTASQLARLRRVAETCPIRRALAAGFVFDERFVPEPPVAHPRAA